MLEPAPSRATPGEPGDRKTSFVHPAVAQPQEGHAEGGGAAGAEVADTSQSGSRAAADWESADVGAGPRGEPGSTTTARLGMASSSTNPEAATPENPGVAASADRTSTPEAGAVNGTSVTATSSGGEAGGLGADASEVVAQQSRPEVKRAAEGGDGDDGDVGAGPDGGHVRTGEVTSSSVKYSQEITSPEDEPEREGRSLATTHHEVIKQWAEERGGTPATVEGTEHGDHLGVLRVDFGGDNKNLRHVTWEEWFHTFDVRRLNFIYQEQRRDGSQSNFFRLESPDREDG